MPFLYLYYILLRQHVKKLLRLIDINLRSIEVVAVASDDSVGTLADG